MIIDRETNTVLLSDKLKDRFPKIEKSLSEILLSENITLKIIPNTADIWCRDYMPIQVNDEKFVQYIFSPDYLNKWPELITPPIDLHFPIVHSSLKLDGGNLIKHKNKAIVSDKIYLENPHLDKIAIRSIILEDLEIDDLIVIPHQPYDVTGHADGMVRFIDEKTIFVNDFYNDSDTFRNNLHSIIKKHNLDIIPFPYFYPPSFTKTKFQSALGCYINYLEVNNTIIVPAFGNSADDDTQEILNKTFPSHSICPIQANELAEEGGLFNCITWNIKL